MLAENLLFTFLWDSSEWPEAFSCKCYLLEGHLGTTIIGNISVLKSPSGRCRAKRLGVEVPENETPRKCAKNEVFV
jgi:hypothetical protein